MTHLDRRDRCKSVRQCLICSEEPSANRNPVASLSNHAAPEQNSHQCTPGDYLRQHIEEAEYMVRVRVRSNTLRK